MSKIKGIGVLGAGRVSRDHAYAATHISGVELVAVADPDADRANAFGAEYGCDTHTDHRQLLQRDDVDLVLAGVPHSLHGKLVVDALEAGKHVMIEKPMAITLEECDAMIAAAERSGMQLMVGHTQHFFPANLAVKKLISEGAIGDLVMATQAWHKPFGLASRPPWMLDRALGGGMWMTNGAHLLDLLIWLVDSLPVAVKGMVTNKIVQQKADDSVLAMIEFANGVCATVAHTGSKRPEPAPFEQYMTTEMFGTEGSVRVISYEGKAWINTDGTDTEVGMIRDMERERAVAAFINRQAGNAEDTPVAQSVIEQTSGILGEVAAYVSALNSGSDVPVSNTHARKVVEVMLAVEESAKTGREVRLD